MPVAMRALETWLFCSLEDLQHLSFLGTGGCPHGRAALAPSGDPVV